MSYILDALKKSQHQRELGQVPRLGEAWLEPMPDRDKAHPWMVASAILAGLALLVAVYALLQPGADAPSSADPSGLVTPPRSAPPIVQPEAAAPRRTAGSGEASTPSGTLGASGTDVRPDQQSPEPDEPDGPDGPDGPVAEEPSLMVVPHLGSEGHPLPRGADEIRRALLGDRASRTSQPTPGAALDRLLQVPADLSQEAAVPGDLKAEIEAFKQSVTQRGGIADGADSRSAGGAKDAERGRPGRGDDDIDQGSASQTEAGASAPGGGATQSFGGASPAPRPSASARPADVARTSDGSSAGSPPPELRQRMPPFRISVHVYNDSPGRRFVYINGTKLKEREAIPEGLKVEEITKAGVILSFEGERFFEPR